MAVGRTGEESLLFSLHPFTNLVFVARDRHVIVPNCSSQFKNESGFATPVQKYTLQAYSDDYTISTYQTLCQSRMITIGLLQARSGENCPKHLARSLCLIEKWMNHSRYLLLRFLDDKISLFCR